MYFFLNSAFLKTAPTCTFPPQMPQLYTLSFSTQAMPAPAMEHLGMHGYVLGGHSDLGGKLALTACSTLGALQCSGPAFTNLPTALH